MLQLGAEKLGAVMPRTVVNSTPPASVEFKPAALTVDGPLDQAAVISAIEKAGAA